MTTTELDIVEAMFHVCYTLGLVALVALVRDELRVRRRARLRARINAWRLKEMRRLAWMGGADDED